MDQKKFSKLSDVKLKKKKAKQSNDTEFYPRVINETNVRFLNDELARLNKPVEYN